MPRGALALLAALLALGGCASRASLRQALGGAQRTIEAIADLAVSVPLGAQSERLDATEEAIDEACADLVEVARRRIEGRPVPLLVQLRLLLGVGECTDTVDSARYEVERLRERLEESPGGDAP